MIIENFDSDFLFHFFHITPLLFHILRSDVFTTDWYTSLFIFVFLSFTNRFPTILYTYIQNKTKILKLLPSIRFHPNVWIAVHFLRLIFIIYFCFIFLLFFLFCLILKLYFKNQIAVRRHWP